MLLPAPPCSGKAELTMKRHISQVVRNRFYHIQQLNQIRRLPGPEDWSNGQAHDIIDFQPTWLLQRCARQSTYLDHITSDITVTETQTDTEMIDISKTHTETNTEKIFNTDTIYI